MNEILKENYKSFLDKIFNNLQNENIDVSGFELDHICYRVATENEYYLAVKQLEQSADLLGETKVNGRNISTFRLHDSLKYKVRKISLLELPSPKENSFYESGFEHVEFVIDIALQNFIEGYPGLNFETSNINKEINAEVRYRFADGSSVKFHNESLETIIEKEKMLEG